MAPTKRTRLERAAQKYGQVTLQPLNLEQEPTLTCSDCGTSLENTTVRWDTEVNPKNPTVETAG